MGFLDHTTNNIIVDAVLTDAGREKLAQSGAGGGLNIQKYAFADNEVDYTLLKKYGETVGKEKIEKNTPIFEANTDSTAQYNLLYDYVTGNVPTIVKGAQGITTTDGFKRLQSTENSSTAPNDGEDFEVGFTLKGFPANTQVAVKWYFNANAAVNLGSATAYAAGISGAGNLKYLTQDVQIGNNGQKEVTQQFMKIADTEFSGVRNCHVVLEVDVYGTMNSISVPITFS